MVKKSALVVLVVTFVCAAMLAVPTATATTEPAVTFFVRVPVTDSRVAISCPACPGFHQFRRGWAAHFDVVNRGTKPYTVDIGGLRTRELRPDRGSASAPTSTIADGSSTRSWQRRAPKHKGWLRVI